MRRTSSEPSPIGSVAVAARFAAAEADQRDVPSFSRPLPREQDGVLTNRAKIRREPIADVNKALRHVTSCGRCWPALIDSDQRMPYSAACRLGLELEIGTISASLRALRMTWPLIHA